jgi:hypothetical protein
MNSFFSDWVFNPGFPHFSIDSVKSVPAGPSVYNVTVYTRQRQRGTSHIYKMPVLCNLTNGNRDTSIVLNIDTLMNVFNLSIFFKPLWVSLDRNEYISDAITDYEIKISATGILSFPETNISIDVKDTATGGNLIRIEYNWVKPDGFKRSDPGIRLSDYHYWKVDGILAPGFLAKGTFTYDGSSTDYLDNTLITGKEDSLLILYRASTADDWIPVIRSTFNKGSNDDRKGSFTVDTLKKGEYVLGIYDYPSRFRNIR